MRVQQNLLLKTAMKTLGSLILLVVGLLVCMYGAVGLIGTIDGEFLSPLSLALGFGSLAISFLLLLASNKLVRVGRYLYMPLAVPLLGWLIAVSISFSIGGRITLSGTLIAVVCCLIYWIVSVVRLSRNL